MKRFLIPLILLPSIALAQIAPPGPIVEVGSATPSMGEMALCSDGTYTRALKCSAGGYPVMTVGTGATDLGKAEDATHTSGDTGVLALGVRGTGALCGTNGDYCPLQTNATGALRVDIRSDFQDAPGTGLLKAEDTTTASGDAGVYIFGIAQTAPTAPTATSAGDYVSPNIDTVSGGMYVNPTSSTARVCVDITPDTNAYAAGDIVGGLLTFANATRATILSGTLQSLEVWGSEVDGIGYTFCPFTANPTASTVADQGALVVHVDDRAKWEGCIPVSTGTALAASEMYEANGIGKPIKLAATSMYGVLRTVGAPTFAAAQKISVCAVIYQD